MKAIFSVLFCLFLITSYSQQSDTTGNAIAQSKPTVYTKADTIVVRKDGRLDILNNIQAKLNKRAAKMTYNGLYHGYRLQVLSTQSREQAFDLKGELLQRFPEQKTYALYQSPYFKVRFGNFIDREEALRYKKTLSSIYPQVIIYIVNDDVDYTPPKDEDIATE